MTGLRSNHIAFRILKYDVHHGIGSVVPGTNLYGAVVAQDSGIHGNAGAAEEIHVKVVLVQNHQVNITVDAAVEGEVSLLGIDPVVDGVINFHQQIVFSGQHIGNIGTEGGVAAVVGGDFLAVQNHLSRCIDATELQVNHFVFLIERGGVEGLAVSAGTAPVVVAAVLAVQVVPGVGYIHGGNRTVVISKGPGIVEQGIISHGHQHLLIYYSVA